jgi:tripartite-type tricarboxylate transporter receptor subunit TctC
VHRPENGGLYYSDLRHETDTVRAAPLSLSLSLPHKGGGNGVAPLFPIANRHSRIRRIGGALIRSALTAFTLALTPAAHADDFYRGKTISLIIGSNTSGGYDTYGRLLARHMGKHIAGHPAIVVQNMPGAGGLRSANHIYNVAAKDGTVIGIFDQAVFLDQLLGAATLRGDAAKFNWIGRMIGNSAVLFAWHTAKVKSIADAFTQELIVAAPGSSSRLNWTALNALAGTKLKLLTGYEGPASAKIAMERGEVEAMSLPWAVLQAENPEWLRDKKINLLLQTGLEKNRTLPDLPRMVDLPKSDDDRKVLEIFALSSVVGRSFVAPPAVPKERVDELRAAFMATVKDADFLADIAKLNFDLEPMAGAELQAFIAKDYPAALIERAKEIARRN